MMNTKQNFRLMAKARLAEAKLQLATERDERLKYTALELRMAIEAITYDRAQAFRDEIPPSEYETWQPKKVMQLLLAIDPTTDQTSTLRFGLEPAPGVSPHQMHSMGTEKVFNLKSIKEHYDALGSHLHLPTLRQFERGAAANPGKLRSRCIEIAAELDAVLASPVYNITLGSFATLPCARCQKLIRKRMPRNASRVDANCFECGAPYEIRRIEGTEQVEWHELITKVPCRAKGCSTEIPIWQDQAVVDAAFSCPGCSTDYRLRLGMVPDGPKSS